MSDLDPYIAPEVDSPGDPCRSEVGLAQSTSPTVSGSESLDGRGNSSSTSGKARKARREKPHIELAPGQPPTTQGKPRQRVFVACLQCRSRKIRCDGAKPICYNCNRRPDSFLCSYDATPKRRGPDRLQGARQRSAKGSSVEPADSTSRGRRRRVRSDSGPSKSVAEGDAEAPTCDFSRFPAEYPLSGEYVSVTEVPTQGWVSQNFTAPFVEEPPYSAYPLTSDVRSPSSEDLSGTSDRYKLSGEGSAQYGGQDIRVVDFQNAIADLIPVLDGNPREKRGGRLPNEEVLAVSIAAEPSLCFARKTWWDSLLTFYSDVDLTSDNRSLTLTVHQRELGMRRITSDLRALFRISNYWFAFFNVPRFLNDFFDTRRRENMQPSLVLAALAVVTFLHSSEVEEGEAGRLKAMKLRDEAQAALEASLNARWIDSSLAQAAWLLAFFEVCSHRHHSSARVASALFLLDGIIRSLYLTLLDADDPQASLLHASYDRSRPRLLGQPTWGSSPSSGSEVVSSLGPAQNATSYDTMPYTSLGEAVSPGCTCASMSLGNTWSAAKEYTPLWLSTPAWDDTWSEAEIKKEECRRLCWSTLFLACGHSNYAWAHRERGLNLFVVDPANYALLTPGESLTRSPCFAPLRPGVESIWALYSRIMLLWSSCLRMRCDETADNTQKAHFAVKAWLFADSIEEMLDKHTCNIERSFMFLSREYLFNIRMCISHEYQQFIPQAAADFNGIFHRRKADEWLRYQTTVAQRVMQGLNKVTGQAANVLAKRPLFVFHFMAQVSRTLSLWARDNTYVEALEVSKALLPPIDYLSALWPCPEQRSRYERLRAELNEACYIAGITPPPPPNFRLPSLEDPNSII